MQRVPRATQGLAWPRIGDTMAGGTCKFRTHSDPKKPAKSHTDMVGGARAGRQAIVRMGAWGTQHGDPPPPALERCSSRAAAVLQLHGHCSLDGHVCKRKRPHARARDPHPHMRPPARLRAPPQGFGVLAVDAKQLLFQLYNPAVYCRHATLLEQGNAWAVKNAGLGFWKLLKKRDYK